MSKIDLSRYNIRTDLIIENEKISHTEENIDGIIVTKTDNNGHYITLSFEDITDNKEREKVENCLINILKDILKQNNIDEQSTCLIIGLGNILSTPDSLGVKSLNDIIVTSHLKQLGKLSKNMRSVSTFAPGVMANTGIESAKIITSLIKEIKPDFVIAIDALASRNIDRINKTIQVTDTGIHPGSGIGNNRMEISKNTMHIPVIAIGVPTVVLSSTIVYDTIEYLYKHISYLKDNEELNKLTYYRSNYKAKLKDKTLSDEEKANLLGLFGKLDEKDKRSLIEEVLNNISLNMIVTPTEIDFLINKLSTIIAVSINRALHRQIT